MEYRIVISQKEAFELSNKLKFIKSEYTKDEYTGTKRIRTNNYGIQEKEYITPVTGVIHKITSLCELNDIKNIWFEFRWTEKLSRFEVEFENKIPEQYQGRQSIKGWNILTAF